MNRNLHFYHIATKKITAGFLAVFLLFNTVFLNPEVASAQFLNSTLQQADSEDLILILAESSLLEDGTNYQGLSRQYGQLSALELEDRIKRYATNLSKTNKSANVDIVSISKNQSPADIADFLKQVYLQNNPAFQNQNLKGIVLVGKVAIPSLQTESGSQFSMYPYTDFLDPIYKLDPLSKRFVLKADSLQDPEPEIFHGVIDFDTPQELAEYLDKNHLYYEGHEDFANIEQKMFVSEPKYEIENLNTALVERYSNYLLLGRYLVDNKVSAEMYQQLTGESQVPPDKFAGDLLEKQYVEFIDLFQNAIGNTQREVEQTGRYTSNQYSSPLIQMAAMDRMLLEYLHGLNQVLQSQFIEITSGIQRNIDIYAGGALGIQTKLRNGNTELSSNIKFANGGRNPGFVQIFLDLPLVSEVMEAAEIFGADPRDLITEAFDLVSDNDAVIDSHLPQIAGVDADELTSAGQCRLYKGGGTNQFGESTVTLNRALIDNQNPSELEVACYPQADDLDGGKIDEDDWEQESSKAELKECTQFGGQDLIDKYRTSHADLEYNSLVTAESCFAMRTVNRYRQLILDEYDMSQSELIREFNRPQTSEIVLDTVAGKRILLSDLITQLPGYTGRDATDWHAWSAYLFGNPVQNSFVITDPYGPDSQIEQITINVSKRNFIKSIPSHILHDGPTLGDFRNSSPATRLNFPVDTHPFVSFYDREGTIQKLTIPNVFDYKSFDEFESAISQLSTQLVELGAQTSFYNQVQSVFTNQNSDVTSQDAITQYSKPKLEFLIDYQGLDINQRYTQILNAQLNDSFQIDLFDLPKSYEIAHLTSDSSDDSIVFSISNDPNLFNPQQIQVEDQTSEEILEEPEEQTQEQFEDLLTYFTEYLPSWYEQTIENMSSVVSFVSEPLASFDEEIYNTNQTIKTLFLEAKASDISLQEPKSNLIFQALDENNLPINPQNLVLSINTTGDVQISTPDIDPNLNGHQILFNTQTQNIPFEVTSTGPINFEVSLIGFNPENIFSIEEFQSTVSTSLTAHSQINPQFEINSSEFFVNSDNNFEITYSQTLQDGTVIQSPRPQLSLENTGQLEILQAEQTPQVSFEHTFTLKPLTKAGDLELKLVSNALEDLIIPIKVLPRPAKEIQITEDSKLEFNVNTENQFIIKANFLDEFGNIDTTYNSQATLNLTSPDSLIVESLTTNATDGVAQFAIQTRPDKFGMVSFNVTTDELQSKTGRIKLLTGLSNAQLDNFESKALIYNLVTTSSDYLTNRANLILNSGITQSIITSLNNYKNPDVIAAVSPKGGILINDTTTVKPSISADTNKIQAELLDSSNNQLLTVDYQPGDLPVFTNQGIDYTKTGLFINVLSEEVTKQQNEFLLLDQELFSLNQNNIPQISDPRYKLEVLNSDKGLELGLFAGSEPIIYFAYNFSSDSQVSLVKKQLPEELSFYNLKIGDSTNVPESTIIGSSSLQKSPALINSRQSARFEKKMQGFSNGDKTNLFLASSMSVGESVRPYQDISSIVVGDPNIRLSKTRPNFNSNMLFDQQIGHYLGRMTEDINKVVNTKDQIIFAEQAGSISVLDKQSSRLYKNVAQIPSGIKNIQVLKDNGQLELLILTNEQCLADDNCLYFAKPNQNQFNLQKANLITNSRILQTYVLEVDDNQTPDLLTFDSSGNLDLYLNPNLNNPSKPLTLTKVTTGISSFDIDIFDFLIQSPEGTDIAIINPDQTQTDFKALSLKNTPKFSESNIQVRSNQGTTVGAGDILDITLNINSQGSSSSDTIVFDFPSQLELIPSSLSPDNAFFADTNDSIFNKAISNLTLRSGLNQITFQAQVKPQSQQSNPVVPQIAISQTASQSRLKNLDIFQGSDDFYTELQLNLVDNILRVRKVQKAIPTQEFSLEAVIPDGLINPEDLENTSSEDLSAQINSLVNSLNNSDADADGIPDEFDSYVNAGNQALESAQDAASEFFCEGAGCLITPVNKAFLSPPLNPNPIFGWGCPNPSTVATSLAALSCAAGRIYFVPTLTGEFASAVCLGPYVPPPTPGSPCWFASLFDLGPACDAINQVVIGILNRAQDIVANGIESATGIGLESTADKNITLPGFPGFVSNWFVNQVSEIVKAFDVPDITIIIPDFSPNSDFSISDPIKGAKEEFGYLISGPEVDKFNPFPNCPVFQAKKQECGGYETEQEFNQAKKSFWTKLSKRPEDLLAELSKMPAINLNTVPVNFNIPELPPKILLKYQKDILLTLQANMISFLNALSRWGCLPEADIEKFNQFAEKVQEAESLRDIPVSGLTQEQQQTVEFGKIFGSLFTTWDQTDIPGDLTDLGVVFRYNKRDYSTFRDYVGAIEQAYKGYSFAGGTTKLIEDMVKNKELTNFLKIANERKLRQTPPDPNAQSCIQLSLAFEGFVGNLSENLEILRAYRDVPKQIFEIENILYFYSDQAAKYLDVVLGEWLSFIDKNTAQIQSWTSAIQTVQNLIRDFNLLLDISANFISQCDDCRTDRSNAELQLIFNLLLGAPELPVLRFDVFPDFVLDLTDIQGGLEIDIPVPKITRQIVELPEFKPVIIWPDAPRLDFIAFVEGIEVPLIPEPPKLEIELPPFPPLNTFSLPVLPNPPDISQLDLDLAGRLEAPMEFVQNVFDLMCIIRKGLTPIPENKLGASIESITNRPLTPVLPIDKAFKITYPGYSGEYVEKYKVTLQSKLNFGFDKLVDLVQQPASSWNQNLQNVLLFYQNLVDQVEEDLSQEIQVLSGLEDLGAKLPQDKSLVDVIAELPQEIETINQSLDKIAEYKKVNTHLKAQIEPIDFETLNKLAAEIPSSQKIANYKYLDPKSKQTLAQLQDYLQNNKIHGDYTQVAPKLIASQTPQVSNKVISKNVVTSMPIAFTEYIDIDRVDEIQPIQDQQTGVYVTDNQNQVTNIIKNSTHTQEKIRVTMADLDLDTDIDVLYSAGNEFYIKENYSELTSRISRAKRPSVFQFENVFQENSKLDMQSNETSFTSNHNSVQIQLPAELGSSSVVVEIYKNSLQARNPYKKIVVSNQVESNQNVSSARINQVQILRDDFAQMQTIQSTPSSINIPLDLGIYSYDVFIVDQLTTKAFQRNINFTVDICADRTPPTITLTPQVQKLVYRATHNFDLSESFDSESGLKDLFVDTNLDVDSDNDGIRDNDKNINFNINSPIKEFTFGPFTEFNNKSFKVYASDFANNKSESLFNYPIQTPKINITEVNKTHIKGVISPVAANMPLEIVQKKSGSSEIFAETSTNSAGEFTILMSEVASDQNPDLNPEQIDQLINNPLETPITISNPEVGELFDISRANGNVISKHPKATIKVRSNSTDTNSSNYQLFFEDDYLTSIHKTGDNNLSVNQLEVLEQLVSATNPVSIVDMDNNDQINLKSIGFENPELRGSVFIKDDSNNTVVFILKPNGSNIVSHPQIKLELEKITDLNQDQKVFISYKNKIVAAYLVKSSSPTSLVKPFSSSNTQAPVVQTQSNPDTNTTEQEVFTQDISDILNQFKNKHNLTDAQMAEILAMLSDQSKDELANKTPTFADIDPNSKEAQTLRYLQEKGIIEGSKVGGLRYFFPNKLITRAEYAKIILKVLCISPRPESYLQPSVFDDIAFGELIPWFYDETKETFLLGLFEGYKGERNTSSLLTPFKPLNPISQIEAVKVIMQALDLLNVIDTSDFKEVEPWYQNYLDYSLNLTPIQVGDLKQTFLLTETESKNPDKKLTRIEFAEIAKRTLDIRNCIADREALNLPTEDIFEQSAADQIQATQDLQAQKLLQDPNRVALLESLANQLADLIKQAQTPTSTTQDSEALDSTQLKQQSQAEQLEAQAESIQSQLEQISASVKIEITDQDNTQSVVSINPESNILEDIACDQCPCQYTIESEEFLSESDVFFAILRNPDKTLVLDKSNALTITNE